MNSSSNRSLDRAGGYRLQHKSWVTDPDGVMWEAFFTEGVVDSGYGTVEMPNAV